MCMHFNGQTVSDALEQLSFTPKFLVKNAKIDFSLRKMGLSVVFIENEV